ncbi:SAM-dependent methyltransferase [Candidatus Poribacteria bacterium]|nr:SAM-dependent methyltransferase [Candidatus Poribacteria bacterium]
MTQTPSTQEVPNYTVNQVEFWEGIYHREESPGWDIGQAAPPFVAYLDREKASSSGKVAVIGCGRGNDVLLFAQRGFEVTAVDFSSSAIQATRQQIEAAQLQVSLSQQDIFTLIESHPNTFDYVVEYTCFCAIDPDRRPEYVDLVHQILKPNGMLIAIFYLIPPDQGPPFGTTEDEIRSLFTGRFEVVEMGGSPHSIERRAGKELFALLKKR